MAARDWRAIRASAGRSRKSASEPYEVRLVSFRAMKDGNLALFATGRTDDRAPHVLKQTSAGNTNSQGAGDGAWARPRRAFRQNA